MKAGDLLHYVRYNAWANRKITRFVLDAGEATADMPLASSFSTIRLTLEHMLAAQDIWMKRLAGEENPGWTEPAPEPLADCCGKLTASSDRFVELTKSHADTDLEKPLNYKSFKGDPFTNLVGHIVMHVVNHGTYHRGQVVSMLRQAGYTKLGSTDYITFCREEEA